MAASVASEAVSAGKQAQPQAGLWVVVAGMPAAGADGLVVAKRIAVAVAASGLGAGCLARADDCPVGLAVLPAGADRGGGRRGEMERRRALNGE